VSGIRGRFRQTLRACFGLTCDAVRLVRVVVGLVVVAGVAVLGYWAGRAALEPPSNPIASSPQTLSYVVEAETVGRSLNFAATAEWELTPVGRNGAAGVVTSVSVEPGSVVAAGDPLYSVDLRPVVVAQGDVPMFRSLGLRDEGPDVAQLQELLSELGFYEGETDGSFGVSTRTAVKAWQDSVGVVDDGVVARGDVVFVPLLPGRVVLADAVTVGAPVSGGEVSVFAVPEAPDFRIRISPEQASLVPLTAEVRVDYADGIWDARITQVVESDINQLDLVLTGADGDEVCGSECSDWVSLTDPTTFASEIVVVPETTGPGVPVAGITTDAGNNAFVTVPDGSQIPVEVLASSNGIAVVDGVDVGTEILIPASG
jgi:peptidoglycan hydrolase-like protein with peptidoglycan-binding domain